MVLTARSAGFSVLEESESDNRSDAIENVGQFVFGAGPGNVSDEDGRTA